MLFFLLQELLELFLCFDLHFFPLEFEQGINSQMKTGFRPVENQALISEDLLLCQVGFWIIFYCFVTVCRFECCFTGCFYPKGLVGAF